MTKFDLLSPLVETEVIAVGGAIRDLPRGSYGGQRWRKLKGTAAVRLPDGSVVNAELHGYEAHGIGRRERKIKRVL